MSPLEKFKVRPNLFFWSFKSQIKKKFSDRDQFSIWQRTKSGITLQKAEAQHEQGQQQQ